VKPTSFIAFVWSGRSSYGDTPSEQMDHPANSRKFINAVIRRQEIATHPIPGNAGIRERYPLDEALWIWHPAVPGDSVNMVEFRLCWRLSEKGPVAFDLTADQRFILFLDGEEVGRGPDRAELNGWSFHRYGGDLDAGEHEIRVQAWWQPEGQRPCAQVTERPGFALKGLKSMEPILSTGHAGWQVRRLHELTPVVHHGDMGYHVIGCPFELDGSAQPGLWCDPDTVFEATSNPYGLLNSPWRLEVSPSPEQRRERFSGGCIRWTAEGVHDCCQGDREEDAWNGLVEGADVEVPAHSKQTWFWDLERYVCGYPEVVLSGGAGARVELEWAESLYDEAEPTAYSAKGQRNACAGKHWLGFGDRFLHAGGERSYRIPWWRSGRWIRLVVHTEEEALILRDIRPLTTGYPFERAWAFDTEPDIAPMLEICEAGLKNCVHETFVDCPYYEQVMYLGDTRSQALSWMVASGDLRPVVRALELFDRSRWVNGFHAERCPADVPQMSATYSLVYPPLLRDAAWWGVDAGYIRRHMSGMRAALDAALATLGEDGLPAHLPGWLFVDWVHHPGWTFGAPSDQEHEATAPVALHLPVALDAAAQLEDVFGEAVLAERWRQHSRQIMAAILREFYDPSLGCLADNRAHTQYSEHAQALALASKQLPDDLRGALVARLLDPPEDWAKASVYFSIHVHEALLQAGYADAVWERFGFWRGLAANGFVSTVECPEPSRSDCHGWGAHPLYHCLSGLAGMRPDAPGFDRVRIAPCPGPLVRGTARLPHPQGSIALEWERQEGTVDFRIQTPVPGTFVWSGQETGFDAGTHELHFPDMSEAT
jgi:hypothetical protein